MASMIIKPFLTTVKFIPIAIMACWLSPASGNNLIEKCKIKTKDNNLKKLEICLDGAIETSQRQLNTWVNAHRFNLEDQVEKSGRRAVLRLFEQAQNDFEVYRENNCRWYYLANTPSDYASIEYKQCIIRHNDQRSVELSKISMTQDD